MIFADRRIDGAWSWVVTGAAFTLLFLAYGGAYSFGVFFPALASAFDADRADTALVFSIVGGLYSTLGIVSGPAADRFGTRPVVWHSELTANQRRSWSAKCLILCGNLQKKA